jgi:SARP family transcriptional regulator, regulator of embCAB operon
MTWNNRADRRKRLSTSSLPTLSAGYLPSVWSCCAYRSASSAPPHIGAPLGLPGTELIRNAFGAYQFRLPGHGWVDVGAAVLAVHLAEAALESGDLDGAAGHAFVARLITARPFLPGIEGMWADEWRRRLQDLRIRAVECMADVQLRRGRTSAAIQSAELVLGLDELRESGWRILMRGHAAAGNVGTALHAFDRCRLTLREQLGAAPSPSTRAVHSELLR